MRKKLDKNFVGLLLGLLVPIGVVIAYAFVSFPRLTLSEFFIRHWEFNAFAPILSLAVVINLGLFFLFYWQHMNYAARGVILSTFLYAIFIFYLKLA